MEMASNDTEDNQIAQDLDTQLNISETVNIAHPYDVNKILIRNNMILSCRRLCKTGVIQYDIRNIKDVLYETLMQDRVKLDSEICHNQINNSILNDSWLNRETSTLFTEYLSYFTVEVGMEFKYQECTIGERPNHGRILLPIDQNHDVSKTIYYIYVKETRTIAAIFITDYACINHVHNKLSLPTNTDDAVILLYKILISEYIKQADKLKFHQHLLKLSKWQETYKYYKAQMKIKPDLLSIQSIGYCRCLIMLCKYGEAEENLLKLMSEAEKTHEIWYLLAKVQRKRKKYPNGEINRTRLGDYSAAMKTINTALLLNPKNEEALQEQQIIQKLKNPISLRVLSPEHRSRSDNGLSYNILSIDGGGIRGMIAAIWLRELEHITNRTCSSMFQMMAGTSTGAIIAAGLSMPDQYQRTRPAYFASKLVQLYKTKNENIFVRKDCYLWNPSNWRLSLAPRYSSDGRQKLFTEYFRNTSLCECLTDIVIPVVRTGDICTHLFTRNNSLYSTRLVDVLMATTAAPTYFDPYFLNGRYYIDGGVQMNNPTMAAYTKAIEYGYDKDNIYVLSLGTGDYLLDPLVSNKERNAKFYVTNYEHVLKVLFDSQQHNVDYQMSNLMNDRNYYRWQVWFEESMELDNCEENTLNKLENIAYEYWEEMQVYDGDRFHKLCRHLSEE